MEQFLRRFGEFVWEMRGDDGPISGDRHLLRIARAAREHITLGAPANKWCVAVCVPLALYLTRRGFPAMDVHGGVGEWQHTWIALGDGRILDPTADQFNRTTATRMPPIYLGPVPAHYEA
jgi:hypothetical protein